MVAEEGVIVVVCDGCAASFRIPEDKIPAGKTVGLTCPKCGHRSSFTASADDVETKASAESVSKSCEHTEQGSSFLPDPMAGEMERPSASLVFAEEEGDLALVCVEDLNLQKQLRMALELMEYQVLVAAAPHEALKNLRMHTCRLVLVHETFGGGDETRNPVLLYLERLSMSIRREMFVLMLSEGHSTLDSLVAFVRSVNLVLNVRHLPEMERLLGQGLADHQRFYEVFLDAMKEYGRR
ncbi:zinc-ribbon domain-containing protein [Desulfobotulus sp. H1]|uniref:Zinc-ribbon domain-containing protein n=1 Tax=Desulfobotulus pelophilus TaxID=2823377 RepID=A0ABT3N4Z9_9BACT|nr:zinc-ribbon domain-containing protein [Desulfobotulus pelophilus]MCW7752532.1 zinc-ribbon domain-containing protein [Desulfobotulus pelophilus]